VRAQDDILFRDRLKARLGPRAEEFSETLIEMLHALWRDGELHGAGAMCDHCGATEGVQIIGAMTSYCARDGEPDPNHSTPYCPECAQQYREHWTEMWDEYYAGRL